MKHRILYMMIMAAAIFSCQKAEEKADVEAGFDALGRVPKVGIASEINVYQYDKQVSATGFKELLKIINSVTEVK